MVTIQNHGLATIPQENAVCETSNTTLQGEIDALVQNLQAKANRLNKKRRTRNSQVHWITRGRQQTLRRVSAQLVTIRATSVTSYTLYLALQDCLACLDKYSLDGEEERHAGPRNGLPIEQWKAEGEAQELPRIIRALSHVVQVYTPDSVSHMLSLDGKTLVSLHDGSDEQSQVVDLSWVPADPHLPDEFMLTESEHYQKPALSLETFVPTLGPFPILPDGINESQQALLLGLEDALSHHTRVLVNTDGAEETESLLLLFMDRMLQYIPIERILILAESVHHLAHLYQRYRTCVSLEDGIPLSEHYLAQYKPVAPLAPDAQICFSSIHEMQRVIQSLRERDAVLDRQTYDLIIVYDLASLTATWQQVLAYFDASYRVGFGSSSDLIVASLFDHYVIASEVRFQACEGIGCILDYRNEVSVDEQASLSR